MERQVCPLVLFSGQVSLSQSVAHLDCTSLPHYTFMESVSQLWCRLTSYDKYYTNTVVKQGGVPILVSILLSAPPESIHRQSTNSDGIATASSNAREEANSSLQLVVEQLRLNCVIILHNLSFSTISRTVVRMYSAADGFEGLCQVLRRCRHRTARAESITFRSLMMARTSTTAMQVESWHCFCYNYYRSRVWCNFIFRLFSTLRASRIVKYGTRA